MLTTPLLVGLDGEQKMSKSLGNYVGIDEPAGEQFGKIMSIPDALLPDVLRVRDRLAAGADRRGRGGSSPTARCTRTRPSASSARTVADLYHGAGRGRGGRGRVRPGPQGPRRARPTCPSSTCRPARPGPTPWSRPALADSKRAARRAIEEAAVRKCDGEVVARATARSPTGPTSSRTASESGPGSPSDDASRVGCPGSDGATAAGVACCLTCAPPACSLVSRPACRFATFERGPERWSRLTPTLESAGRSRPRNRVRVASTSARSRLRSGRARRGIRFLKTEQ